MAVTDYDVAMLLPEIKVECYAGTGLDFTVPVLNGNGSPVNIVNVASARAQIRSKWQSPDVLHSWTTDVPAGMVLTGVANSGVRIIASGAETAIWQAQWPLLEAVWDLEILDSDGAPHKLCRLSPFTVYPEVTRDL